MGLDITGYGNYGWATTIPVRNIEEAKKVKFRIAEAAVNKLLYKAWGFNPCGDALAGCARCSEAGGNHRSGPFAHGLLHHEEI